MTHERKLIIAIEEYLATCTDEKIRWELTLTIGTLERKIADKLARKK